MRFLGRVLCALGLHAMGSVRFVPLRLLLGRRTVTRRWRRCGRCDQLEYLVRGSPKRHPLWIKETNW